MAERTDEELMRDVTRGDVSGMEPLVQRYKDRLLRYLVRNVGETGLAEDLFQETFLRVYQARAHYRYPLRFSAWLFTIARRLAINAMEKRGLRRMDSLQGSLSGGDGLTLEETLASEQDDPLEALQKEEQRELLEEALNDLPEAQRSLLHLYMEEDLTYPELARVVGCSPGAIKVRFFRAFRMLEDLLRRRLKERT